MTIASQRNPLYARASDAELIRMYRAAEGRRKEAYRRMDAAMTPDDLAAAERALDDNETELFRLDDELCARGPPLPSN